LSVKIELYFQDWSIANKGVITDHPPGVKSGVKIPGDRDLREKLIV